MTGEAPDGSGRHRVAALPHHCRPSGDAARVFARPGRTAPRRWAGIGPAIPRLL